MRTGYAKTMAHYAVSVIENTSGLKSTLLDVKRIEATDKQTLVCELAVSINFNGQLDTGENVSGNVSCGFIKVEDSMPLMKALVRHFKLNKDILSTVSGLTDVLSELLNIIIGLAGADWSGHGFYMDFAPPEIISGRQLLLCNEADSYHVTVNIDNSFNFNMLVSFFKQ